MKHLLKRQRGDAIVSTALALVVIILVMTMLAKVAQQLRYETTASVALGRVEGVRDAMQRAYMENIILGVAPDSSTAYPANGAALVTGGQIEECLAADEMDGYCINRLKLPWVDSDNNDEMIDVTAITDPSDGYPAFTLSFSLANVYPLQLRNMIRSRMSQLPTFTEDSTNTVTITFTRPASEVSLENLVKRDGTTTMTDDWDVGSVYLDNVKDMSYTDLSDRTGMTGLLKLGSVVITSSAGKRVNKQTCPTGYKAEIEVWTQSLGTSTLQYNVKNFASWYVGNTDYWQIYFKSTAENASGTKSYFYEGTVVYATWCDFS